MMNHFEDSGRTISFELFIDWLENKGKNLFGEQFTVSQDDHEVIFKLLVYFCRDKNNAEKLNISLRKGILLTGPIGCGKTSFMTIFRLFSHKDYRFGMKTCRDLSFEFSQGGYQVILKYSGLAFVNDKPRAYCFDDLGTESNLRYFGNDCNVLSEILLSRYDLFMQKRMITHVTTNLTSNEIEAIYGSRVRSRMREMFNLIRFESTSKDKRS